MSSTNCFSNIPEFILVSALMGSPCVSANTLATESVFATTSTNFSVKIEIKGAFVYTTNTSRRFLMNSNVTAIADGLPTPRTEIGRKLLEHRKKALARGMTLLTADEINLMVKEGRGDFS